MACNETSLSFVDVGDAEGEDLSELLASGAEVELATGTLLEDVEAAPEEELPAVIGAD